MMDLGDEDISFRNSDDINILSDVVDYLDENYAEPLEQGPFLLTGSAVYGENPNDYDLSVQRQAKDEREFSNPRYEDRRQNRPEAVSSKQDDHIIAAMMRDLSEDIAFDTYRSSNNIERTKGLIDRSKQVITWGKGNSHNPESRFELRIDGVDFDITFTPVKPNRDYVQLTDQY